MRMNRTAQDLPDSLGRMAGANVVLARNFGTIASPSNTNENTLATVTIPAKVLGPKGAVRIRCGWTLTSSGNNKTIAVKFGGTAVISNVHTAVVGVEIDVVVGNSTSTSAQIAYGHAITPAAIIGAETTAAIDTTADVNIVFNATKASGGETASLKYFIVEVMP